MDGDRLYTDAQLLYFNADLTSQILPYLDMPSLMALAQVDRAGRVMAQEEFRARLKWLLRAFIPEDSFDAFFNMMKRTGTVIVGGISYYLGEFNLPTHPPVPKPMWQWWHVDTATYDMNLLVPLDSWQDAIDWFLDLDCEEFRVEVIAPAFRDSVFSFVSTSFSSGGGCRVSSFSSWSRVEGAESTLQNAITLSACRSDVVDVALLAPWSTQTNIITSSTFVSFFPVVNLTGCAMRNLSETRYLKMPHSHWTTVASADKQKPSRSCRLHRALSKKRWPFYYRGVQSFPLVGLVTDDSDPLIVAARRTSNPSLYKPRCYNIGCRYYVSPFIP